jgi:hypothetical protein
VTAVQEALDVLTQNKKTIRCSEMQRLLVSLGFRVRDGRLGGHKTVSHPQLKGFYGSGYDCGHKADGVLKVCYVLKVAGVLRQYKDELEKLMEHRT